MASFEDDPKDEREQHPCPEPECDGNACKDDNGNWYCDSCDWTPIRA
jgi:hypothetical protein